jgi:hypothetical protein
MFSAESVAARLLADFFSSDSLEGSIAWTTGLPAAEPAAAA